MERVGASLAALRANIARGGAEGRSRVVAGDAFARPSLAGEGQGEGFDLAFLDPPYGDDLVPRALAGLRAAGCLAPGALVVAETGRSDPFTPPTEALTTRAHGAARLTVWRE